jgi:hypothetical protein
VVVGMNKTIEQLKEELEDELKSLSANQTAKELNIEKKKLLENEFMKNEEKNVFSDELNMQISNNQKERRKILDNIRNSESKIKELKELIEAKEKIVSDAKEELKDETKEAKTDKEEKKTEEEIEEELSKTVELPVIKEEDTLELPDETVKEINNKKEDNKIKKVENVKVVYNAQNGLYTVSALVDGELKTSTNLINGNLINSNSLKDTNIIPLFERFDKDNNTNLKQQFSDDKLEYKAVYDLRKSSILHKSILKRSERKELKKFAVAMSKKNDNIDYISNNFSKKKAAILLGVGLTGGAAIYGVNSVNNNKIDTKTVIESTTETKTTEEKTTKKEDAIVENTTTEQETEYNKNDVIATEKEEITTENLDTEPTIDYKVGDKVNLENADLYYSSTALEPSGNTERVKCDNYKITMISVTHDDKIIDVIKDNSESINELKDKYSKIYGDDFRILFNSDALDSDENIITKNVGWVDSSDLINEYENVKTK